MVSCSVKKSEVWGSGSTGVDLGGRLALRKIRFIFGLHMYGVCVGEGTMLPGCLDVPPMCLGVLRPQSA